MSAAFQTIDQSVPRIARFRLSPFPEEPLDAVSRLAQAPQFNGVEFDDREPESDAELPPLRGDLLHDLHAFLPPIVAPLETLELLETGTLVCTSRIEGRKYHEIGG